MEIKRVTCHNCGKGVTIHAFGEEPDDVSLSLAATMAKEEARKAAATALHAVYLDMSIDTQVTCPHCGALLLAKMT